jgi:ABC-type nickel/cobalt efflux system permease component RcnA
MEMQKWIEFSLLLLLLIAVYLMIRRPLKRREMFRLADSRFRHRKSLRHSRHNSKDHHADHGANWPVARK